MYKNSLSSFVESLETQFTDLGLTLTKVDDELEWQYHLNDSHKATIKAVVSTGFQLITVKFFVESFTTTNEDGTVNGTIWGTFDDVESALIRLLKVIGEAKRESLNA
jgi:hypothetical protein